MTKTAKPTKAPKTLDTFTKQAARYAAQAKKHAEGEKKDAAKARLWRKRMKRAQRRALPLKKAALAKAEADKKAAAAAAAAEAKPAEGAGEAKA